MTELKPCPFCGEKPIVIDDENSLRFIVECETCGACAAITAWNTRAKPVEPICIPRSQVDDNTVWVDVEKLICTCGKAVDELLRIT